jgi:hypothetical protein
MLLDNPSQQLGSVTGTSYICHLHASLALQRLCM